MLESQYRSPPRARQEPWLPAWVTKTGSFRVRTGAADYDGDDTLKNFELTYDVRTAASVEAEALSGRLSLFAEALMATYSTDLARWPGVQYRAPIWSLETGDRPVGEDVLRVVSYLKD